MSPPATIQRIETDRIDSYLEKVESSYDHPPEVWQKVLGEDLTWCFGLFEPAEIDGGATPGPVGPSEIRAFERQLELAGLMAPDRPHIYRILDVGCGWGFSTQYMAKHFIECQRIDAVNISKRQLEYCAQTVPEIFKERVKLYLLNGRDIDLLPDPEQRYDLVIVRGAYAHFSEATFEASVARIACRLAPGGTLLINDAMYSDLGEYQSAIPDKVDRMACGSRKTRKCLVDVLENQGLHIHDMRVLPSNAEVIHWFRKVQLNIEQNFPNGRTAPIQEVYDMALSFPQTLAKNKASTYSIVARRGSG